MGGGGGGGAPPPYGNQGDCPVGYLYFSDGCETDGTNVELYPAGWQNFLNYLIGAEAEIAAIKFLDSHFWPNHLACYLTGSTNNEFDQAAANDYNVNHYRKAGDPPVGKGARFVFAYHDANTGYHQVTYGIFHYGELSQGVVTYDTYVVGTAFIPTLPNCR